MWHVCLNLSCHLVIRYTFVVDVPLPCCKEKRAQHQLLDTSTCQWEEVFILESMRYGKAAILSLSFICVRAAFVCKAKRETRRPEVSQLNIVPIVVTLYLSGL